jgi:16S rRNA (guanine527-N7)-methyltransferase
LIVIPTVLIHGLDVSRETEARLSAFAALVARWNPRINLVSAATLAQFSTRHLLDSMQLWPLARPGWQHWADLGSGGGFPGIVIAILATEHYPAARISLVESDQRKATFLRTAARELALPVDVHAARAESLAPLQADVLSARALASLSALLPLAQRHLGPDGRALFPKGRRYNEELTDTRRDWTFDLTLHPSLSDPEARILQIERIAHV